MLIKIIKSFIGQKRVHQYLKDFMISKAHTLYELY